MGPVNLLALRRGVIGGWRHILSGHCRPSSYGDAAESTIVLAENLWVSRGQLCTGAYEGDEALARVLGRLTN